MKRDWSTQELAAQWSLLPSEKRLLGNKTGATRLGFAVLLKFFQAEGRFPRHAQEIPESIVGYIAPQVGVESAEWPHYDWRGRTIEYHRAQIRGGLGFGKPPLRMARLWPNGWKIRCWHATARWTASKRRCTNVAASCISSHRHRNGSTA